MTGPTVLTAADPVSVLEHQLEKRGSFNPLEAPSSAGLVESTAAGIGLSSTAQNRGAGGEGGKTKSDTLIVVPAKFKVKKGQQVAENIFIGDPIGKGLQVSSLEVSIVLSTHICVLITT
eukprot:jgi/Botrbrau1/22386/Bobra.0839s0001.1